MVPAYEVKTVKMGGIHIETGHVTASLNNKLCHLPVSRTIFCVWEFVNGRLQEFEVEEELGCGSRGPRRSFRSIRAQIPTQRSLGLRQPGQSNHSEN